MLRIIIWRTVIMSAVCYAVSCGENDVPTVKIGKNLSQTDNTVGIESIASRIDTLTFRTDTLYDISIFGISDSRIFGMTADRVIVILNHDGQVMSSHDIHGRGPGEFADFGGISYDHYNDEILLYDTWNKVIRLDADGKFKDEVKNSETADIGDIAPISRDLYAATGISSTEREYSISILDRYFNPVRRMFPLMNDAQRSQKGIISFEGLDVFNSKVLYKPFGEYTYYEIRDSTYTPYLRVDCGRYEMPAELHATVDNPAWDKYFQLQYEAICGKYYLVQYLYVKNMLWYYDVYDIETGERVLHNSYGQEDYESGADEGFIFRYGGQTYRIIPQFEQDNILYWSRFNDDGTTTLFSIYL